MPRSLDAGYAEMETAASRLGGRIRQINLLLPSWDRPADRACTFRGRGVPRLWATNGARHYIEFSIASPFVLAAGVPDTTLLMADSAFGSVGEIKVYERSDGSLSPRAWMADPGHGALLLELGLQDDESLLIGTGQLAADLLAGGDASRPRLDVLARIAEAATDAGRSDQDNGRGAALKVLPEPFRSMSPLADEWAIPDDFERAAKIEDASRESLSELVDSTFPLMPKINAMLDSQAEPHPDELVVLSRLAEAATEAQLELDRRSDSGEGVR